MWFSGVAHALSDAMGGKGSILMLHRVQPASARAFKPVEPLTITPEYLSALLRSFRASDVDIVSLDEAQRRIETPAKTKRFVCFTFDDGYRDNLEHALPILQHYDAPFTVYATTSFVERSFAPWWGLLEVIVEKSQRVRWVDADREQVFETSSLAEKKHTYDTLAAAFLRSPVAQMRVHAERLCAEHGLSVAEFAARETCSAQELRELQAGGADIGCHTVSHAVLTNETPETVRDELAHARTTLERMVGRPVRHLAYPYGEREHVGPREFAIARELGFATATTTRKGAVFGAHAQHLHALPRVEVTPIFARSPRYLQTIVSGLPLWLWNRGRYALV